MNPVEIQHGARTDVGRVRDANQDAYLAEPPIFVVADGMGGHQGGEVASRIVVEEFSRLAVEGYDPGRAETVVNQTLGACQARILEYAAQQRAEGVPDRHHAGTTAVVAVLVDDDEGPGWLIANIGDSRAYRYAEGRLEQVSVDHSVVQQLVDSGQITRQAAAVHPERHLITRALGDSGGTDADLFRLPLTDVERLVLCSDGVTGMLDDNALATLVGEADDPRDAADRIVEAALEAGGEDNATVVVVDVLGPEADDYDAAGQRRTMERKLGTLP